MEVSDLRKQSETDPEASVNESSRRSTRLGQHRGIPEDNHIVEEKGNLQEEGC